MRTRPRLWAENASVESLIELVQDRDAQMGQQEEYFEAAEELSARMSTLVRMVRYIDGKPVSVGNGRFLYTDEIREVLAERGC